MDPLSITASCIAVAGAGGAAVKGLKKLREWTKLPDVLLSVMNEVADLTLVTQDIRLNLQLRQDSHSFSPSSISVITQLLDRAQDTLIELDQVINYRLLQSPKQNGEITFSRSAWIVEEHRVQRLQASLRTTRLDIAALSLYVISLTIHDRLLIASTPPIYLTIAHPEAAIYGPAYYSVHFQLSPMSFVLTLQAAHRKFRHTYKAAFDFACRCIFYGRLVT